MFSYEFYKVVHLTGIFLILMAYGALILNSMLGRGKKEVPNRAIFSAFHGAGMIFALVGGFGLMAKLNMMTGWPGWVYVKLVIWVFMGGAIAIIFRKPKLAKPMLFVILLTAVLAAFIANYKPF